MRDCNFHGGPEIVLMEKSTRNLLGQNVFEEKDFYGSSKIIFLVKIMRYLSNLKPR